MTTKTVHLDRSVLVTALAELPRCIDRKIITVFLPGDMAVHAPDQAVSLRSNTQMHRDLPVMHQVFIVIAAHHLTRLDTRLTLTAWILRQVDISARARSCP